MAVADIAHPLTLSKTTKLPLRAQLSINQSGWGHLGLEMLDRVQTVKEMLEQVYWGRGRERQGFVGAVDRLDRFREMAWDFVLGFALEEPEFE